MPTVVAARSGQRSEDPRVLTQGKRPEVPEGTRTRGHGRGTGLHGLRPCDPLRPPLVQFGVRLFAAPWTAACQASLSITNSRSSLKITSSHLILCRPLLLPPSIFPSIRVFSSESDLHIRWPKHWSFSFSISPSDEWSA